jgi:hypothetical protein
MRAKYADYTCKLVDKLNNQIEYSVEFADSCLFIWKYIGCITIMSFQRQSKGESGESTECNGYTCK